MKAGFSLLEVLIAGALLAVVGLAVVGAVSQSAREVKTTSDYSLALFLSQKIAEELIQGAAENPHAEEAWRAVDGVSLDVENPLNPYFAGLEDIAAPWGRIDVGPDLGVDARAPALHRLYRDFDLTLAATAAPQAGVEQLTIEYRWPGLKSESRSFAFPLLVAKPTVACTATPLIAQDLPGLDAAVRALLYQNAGGPADLVSFVSGAGASLSAVRDVGGIVVVTAYAEGDTATLASDITTTEAALAAGPDDPELRVAAARLYEKRAVASWQCLLYAKDPAARQSTGLAAADLGGPAVVSATFLFTKLATAIRMRALFDHDTARALAHYVAARRQLPSLGARPYWQYALERKVLELAKLRVMAAESNDVTFVNAWIDALLAQYRGRNRAVTQYLVQEKLACTGLAGIQALHPVIRDRLSDGRLAETALTQLLGRVRAEFF